MATRPWAHREGSGLRTAARLMVLADGTGETTLVAATLIANLVALTVAVAELREARSAPRRPRRPMSG